MTRGLFVQSNSYGKMGTTKTSTRVVKKEKPTSIFKNANSDSNKSLGKTVCKDLSGRTNKEEHDRVEKALKNLNKDNALGFVRGYYDESSWTNNGLIEQIESENDDYNSDYVMNAMKAIIDGFEKAGFDDDDDLKKMREIYHHYKVEYGYGDGSGKPFKDKHGIFPFSSRAYGRDNPDQFDDCTKNLLDKLEKK